MQQVGLNLACHELCGAFHYRPSDGKLCFASEAKGLVDIVDDVKEFSLGYVYSSEFGFQKYAPQVMGTPDFKSPEQAKKVFAQLLEEAVAKWYPFKPNF